MNNKIRSLFLCSLLLWVNSSFGLDSLQWADQTVDSLKNSTGKEYHTAIELCDQLFSFYSYNTQKCKLPEVLSIKSGCQIALGKYEFALSTVIQAQKLHKNNGCPKEQLPLLYHSYSILYQSLNEFEKADSFAILGIKAWDEETGDSFDLFRLYLDRGNVQTEESKAVTLLSVALNIARQLNKDRLIYKVLNDIGYAYASNDNFDESKAYFTQALSYARRAGLIREQGVIYNNLAGLSDDDGLILNYIDSAIHFAQVSKLLASEQVYAENRAYALTRMGRYSEAYDQLWASTLLKDSLLSIRKLEAIAELEEEYEAEKKNSQIQQLTLDKLNSEVESLTYRRNQNNLILGSAALLLLALFFAYSFVNTKRNKNRLAKKNIEIEHARKVSDELLLNILPAEVAEELKEKGRSEARLYNHVTVLFTDFVSFTSISEHMSAEDLVSEINYYFTEFDKITEKYGLEKIKTIGDAYLAVCGLPENHADHAHRAVNAAIDIRELTNNSKGEFKVRIGLNSGPVVAGIVGVKKYAYDIWGDTVNTAARMEQYSEKGKINISGLTYELVKQEYSCEYRGKIEAKNKGEIDMYFVLDKSK